MSLPASLIPTPSASSDDDESLSEMILARRPRYLQNRSADLDRLHIALALADLPVIQSIGHNCKGTGTAYGLPDISQTGRELEAAAKAADLSSIERLIHVLQQQVHHYSS